MGSFRVVLVLLLLLVLGGCHGSHIPRFPFFLPAQSRKPLDRVGSRSDVAVIEKCKEKWRNTTLDHFNWHKPVGGVTTYKQRYFICDESWRPTEDGLPGPIFVYLGNEADVTLYLNATGLMWESADSFGALLLFLEHRYYGKSKPFDDLTYDHLQYLSADQALADYAEAIFDLKRQLGAEDSPVVAFGGSYGGMLGAWMRMKFPHVIDGVIAASAPILTFYGEEPPYDTGSYAKIITKAASPESGSSAACVPNTRKAWKAMFDLSHSQLDRDRLAAAMNLCPSSPVLSVNDVWELAYWAQSAWDYMAMGNYPYETSYILNGDGTLPAWPIRVACDYLKDPSLEGEALLSAFSAAVGVFYNYSAALNCFNYQAGVNNKTSEDGNLWDFQWCTEQFMPMSRDGVDDMFFRQPFDKAAAERACEKQWGIRPRPFWPQINWGGRRLWAASNIVFSNGMLDPWTGGGVLQDASESVVALLIKDAAHHLDLMFSHEGDTEYVKEARETERKHMRKWVQEAYTRQRKIKQQNGLTDFALFGSA